VAADAVGIPLDAAGARFGALLDDEQVPAVVNYVRSHFGNSYPDTVSSVDVRSARP
jgi:mono/diheme cytochrome c family protein